MVFQREVPGNNGKTYEYLYHNFRTRSGEPKNITLGKIDDSVEDLRSNLDEYIEKHDPDYDIKKLRKDIEEELENAPEEPKGRKGYFDTKQRSAGGKALETTVAGTEMIITREQILEAFENTEESIPDYEFRYSPWHFLEIKGERKPVKDVFKNIEPVRDEGITKSSFGTPRAERILRTFDLEFYSKKEDAGNLLDNTLEEILEKYPERSGKPTKDTRLRNLLTDKGPNLVKHILVKNTEYDESDLEVSGSAGKGNWADIPWIGVKSEKKGKLLGEANPVFLFYPDEKEVFLTLAQAVKIDGSERTIKDLEGVSKELIDSIDIPGFEEGTLRFDVGGLGKKYGPATAFYKKYRLEDLPNPQELESDITKITEIYLEELDDTNQEYEDPERKEFLSKLVEGENYDIELPEELYFEEDLVSEINASLNSGKNIIFTGPPGTGKTKLAKSIAQQVQSSENIEGSIFTTATADWTAFDTIGGYMPSNGSENLEFKPGQFLKCFRDGEVTNKWLVIDEINRADIDKAFGQLFSVLSGDSVELPYERTQNICIEWLEDVDENDLERIEKNQDIFPVTDSWRLIATMNTLDKASLYEMSYAFMRRFNFIHVGLPELTEDGRIKKSILDKYADKWDLKLEEDERRQVMVLWYKVNKHREIGPSIIKDILEYMQVYKGENGLEAAIVSLIYPQLEGMRPRKQKEFVNSLSTKTSIGEEDYRLDLDMDTLKKKAEDIFNLSFEDEE